MAQSFICYLITVLLSPSGINAVLTGHSYGATEEGIKELLDEWKLFYPQRFATSSTSSSLPVAVEVVVGEYTDCYIRVVDLIFSFFCSQLEQG